jgi:hypothetical protein
VARDDPKGKPAYPPTARTEPRPTARSRPYRRQSISTLVEARRLMAMPSPYGSNINAAAMTTVGTSAPAKSPTGEIPSCPKDDPRID